MSTTASNRRPASRPMRQRPRPRPLPSTQPPPTQRWVSTNGPDSPSGAAAWTKKQRVQIWRQSRPAAGPSSCTRTDQNGDSLLGGLLLLVLGLDDLLHNLLLLNEEGADNPVEQNEQNKTSTAHSEKTISINNVRCETRDESLNTHMSRVAQPGHEPGAKSYATLPAAPYPAASNKNHRATARSCLGPHHLRAVGQLEMPSRTEHGTA